MPFLLQNLYRYLLPLFMVCLWISCSQDKDESVKKEKPKRSANASLGIGTDTLPTERQLQRYTAALESLERFQQEQKNPMTPEMKQELEEKFKAFKHKIDSLQSLIPK